MCSLYATQIGPSPPDIGAPPAVVRSPRRPRVETRPRQRTCPRIRAGTCDVDGIQAAASNISTIAQRRTMFSIQARRPCSSRRDMPVGTTRDRRSATIALPRAFAQRWPGEVIGRTTRRASPAMCRHRPGDRQVRLLSSIPGHSLRHVRKETCPAYFVSRTTTMPRTAWTGPGRWNC